MYTNAKSDFLLTRSNSLPLPRHLPSPFFAAIDKAGDGVTAVTPVFGGILDLNSSRMAITNFGNFGNQPGLFHF